MIDIKIEFFPPLLCERIKDKIDLALHILELSRLLVLGNFKVIDLSNKYQKIKEESIVVRCVDDMDEIDYNRVFLFKKNSCIATFILPFFLIKKLKTCKDCIYELRLSFSDDRSIDYDTINNMQTILKHIKEERKKWGSLYSLFQTLDIDNIISQNYDKEKADETIWFYREILSVFLFYHDGYARRDIVSAETKSKTPHPLDHLDFSYVYKNYDLKIELRDFQTKDIFDLFNHKNECFVLSKQVKIP